MFTSTHTRKFKGPGGGHHQGRRAPLAVRDCDTRRMRGDLPFIFSNLKILEPEEKPDWRKSLNTLSTRVDWKPSNRGARNERSEE